MKYHLPRSLGPLLRASGPCHSVLTGQRVHATSSLPGAMFPTSAPYTTAVRGSIPVFRDIPEIRAFRRTLLDQQGSVGLVPTMGALHAGHLSLIRRAARENRHVVVSIYVNPSQFGVNEDLDSYPRTWDADLDILNAVDRELSATRLSSSSPDTPPAGRISAVFAPTTKTMYPTLPPSSDPAGQGSFVTITPLATLLEGASRPVFFRGVATVCMKLFNIVAPDTVYFGQKDIQQTVVIKRMVEDFVMAIEVKVEPTTREDDGLAMSSRNVHLGQRRRRVATVLAQALTSAEGQYRAGETSRARVLGPALDLLRSKAHEQMDLAPSQRARVEVDYISLADPRSLEEVQEVDERRGAVLSGAIKMLPVEEAQPGEDCGLGGPGSSVRLIDNILLPSKAP